MRKEITPVLVLLFALLSVAAGVLINGNQINPQTKISISSMTVTGAGGMSVTNGVSASSFTATGNGGFLTTSSSTASAFFGDISHTVGGVLTAGTNVFTGQNTFSNFMVFFSSGIRGITGGNSACAGCTGEYISSATAAAMPFGGNNTAFTVVQITLSAGDWDIRGSANQYKNGATVTAYLLMINSIANSISGANDSNEHEVAFTSTPDEWGFDTPIVHVSPSVPTTYYLIGFGSYSAATPTIGGIISARRSAATN